MKELATEISNYREMMSLTDKEIKFYKRQKVCHICEKVFCTNGNNEIEFKLNKKVRGHCHYTEKFRGDAHNISNLRYKVPKKIPVVFHNGSIYSYYFIIKQLAEKFKGQFECLVDNTEKYIAFSVSIKKELDNGKTSTYKPKLINSYRFMQIKLSSFVDNLSGTFNKECKPCMESKKVKSECDYIGFRDKRLNYRCKEGGKRRSKVISKAVRNFPPAYQFCNGNPNKFVLLLRKGVYLYEYMDSWEKLDENSIPPKEDYYSELNEEGISDADYANIQEVWKKFEIRDIGDNHDLYLLSDSLLLADVYENFRGKFIEIYELDPAHLSAPGLAWKTCLKNAGVNLESLTDIDMLLMVEKGIRGGVCQAIHRYAKVNNKYMNNHDKGIESSCLMYLDPNNLYGWAMSQKLPINGFKWVEDLSDFNESFIKNYDENSDRGYFLEVDADYPKNLLNSQKDVPFLAERKELE